MPWSVLTAVSDADLRTALATERLVTVTWWLVGVGIATLFAALAAAVIAIRTYVLEGPAVAITGRKAGFPEAGPLESGYLVTRSRGIAPQSPGIGAKAEIPVVLQPFWDDPHAVPLSRQVALEFRNLGRTPVIEANVHLRFRVPDIVGFEGAEIQTEERTWDGYVRIKSIAPNELVVLPLVNDVGAFRLEAIGLTDVLPESKRNRRAKTRTLRFVSSEVLVPPP
jgi:hypothetical protein